MPSPKFMTYQLLLTISLVLLLEVLARLAFTIYSGPLYATPTSTTGWFNYSADVGWDRRPNYAGLDDCGAYREFNSEALLAVDADQLKSIGSNQRRVLFLGDSNTYGLCLKTERTFVEVADRLLPEFSLINLGVPGYSSYQGYKTLLKYGEMIKPDITVISFNPNDRRHVIDDADIDSDATFARLASPKGRMLEYSYLFRAVKSLGTKIGIVKQGGSDPAKTVRLDNLRPRVDPQGYRSNLVKMVEWARQHGSAVYFILLGDNPEEVANLREGVAQLSQNNYMAAIKSLQFTIDRSRAPFTLLAKLNLSRAYREAGNIDEAERVLSITPIYSAHGGEPILQDVVYNDVMRKVADEYDVPLIDAKSELDRTPGVFFDLWHFDARGHEIVGELLRDILIKDSGPINVEGSWASPGAPGISK